MSLQKFKENMLRYMQNQEGIGSSDEFANKLVDTKLFGESVTFETVRLVS